MNLVNWKKDGHFHHFEPLFGRKDSQANDCFTELVQKTKLGARAEGPHWKVLVQVGYYTWGSARRVVDVGLCCACGVVHRLVHAGMWLSGCARMKNRATHMIFACRKV
jgi:hypothetical protein